MPYECISIDISCFSWEEDSGSGHLNDRLQLVSQIKEAEDYFLFRYVDIGPNEAFHTYDLLRDLVRSIVKINFQPRILTSGTLFTDPVTTVAQLRELISIGVTKITLRIDQIREKSLSETALVNYVDACSACGITTDVLLEFTDEQIPESYYAIVRCIEARRFYNSLFFRKRPRLKIKQRIALPTQVECQERNYRVIIDRDGAVKLRSRDWLDEISLGTIDAKSRLAELLCSSVPT